MLNWQSYAVVAAKDLTKVRLLAPTVDIPSPGFLMQALSIFFKNRSQSPPVSDPRVLMGAAGITGLTAYFGLLDVGKPVAGPCRAGPGRHAPTAMYADTQWP